MITLDAGATIRGVAGTATAVTYTFSGDEKATSDSYKVLAQGQLPSSAGTLYTAPALTAALIQRIMLANATASAVPVSLYVNGTAATNLIITLTVPANGSAYFTHHGWTVLDSTGAPLAGAAPVTLTGDVTGTGTGTIGTTIANNAVTNAKAADMATATFKGRTTAGTGDPEDLSIAQAKTLLNLTGTNSGDQTITLTGPVTGSGTGSFATAITANAVTNTELADMAAATFKMRALGAGIGDPIDGTAAQAKTALAITPSDITGLTFFATLANLSGDLTTAGTGATTLATVNGNVGSFGTATQVGTFTVDAKGRITAASNTSIQIAESQVTNLVTDLAGKQATGNYLTALTGDGTASGPGSAAFTLATVNAGVGSFGTATQVPTITVNAKGLVTAAANTAIQIAESQVTNLVTDLAGKQASGNYITALTGDVTATGPGSVAATLATVNANVGTFGSASQSVTVTADAKGRITAISQSAISGGGNNFGVVTGNTGTANSDSAGDTIGITGSGNITTVAADTPDGLVITTTPTATSKISSHYYAFGDFNIVGDWNLTFDGTCSTGAPTKITSATANFVAGDLGKQITLTGAGASTAKYVGTITNIDSTTQVTVSPSISTSQSGRGMNWGTNNDTAWGAMATTVNALTMPAVVVEFEKTALNRYGQAVNVAFNKPVILQGQGRAYNADTGNYWQVGGTCIAWVGATSDGGTPFGAALTWVPTGAFNIKGGGLRDIWYDARNGDQSQCLTPIKLASVNGFSIREFFIMDALGIACRFEIDATPTEQESTARGMMSNIGIRMLDNSFDTPMTTPITTSSAVTLTASGQSLTVAANTLKASGYGWIMTSIGRPVLFQYTSGGGTTTLGGCRVSAEDAVLAPVTVSGSNIVQATPGNGCAALLSGNATANTNLSLFQMWQISHGTTWGPAAVEFANADSMVCDSFVINGGSATATNAINRLTKPGVRMNGHDTGVALAARNNVFREGDAGTGGISNMALLNTGAKMTAPAGPNYWWGYQFGNGAAAPNIELGGYLDWTGNGAFAQTGVRNIDFTASIPYTVGVAKQVPGTLILMPPQAIQVGTTFLFRAQMTKTLAGSANRLVHIRIGTTGTVSDPIVMTWTMATTANADAGTFDFIYTITAANSASSTGAAQMVGYRQLGAAGTGIWTVGNGQTLLGTPTVFTSPVSGLWYVSLSITTGTAEVLTTSFGMGQVMRVGNQGA